MKRSRRSPRSRRSFRNRSTPWAVEPRRHPRRSKRWRSNRSAAGWKSRSSRWRGSLLSTEGGRVAIEPGLPGVEIERTSEELANELGRWLRASGREHRSLIAAREPGLQILPVERTEQVLRNDERPHVRVVRARIPLVAQMNEDRLSVRAVDVRIRHVAVVDLFPERRRIDFRWVAIVIRQ